MSHYTWLFDMSTRDLNSAFMIVWKVLYVPTLPTEVSLQPLNWSILEMLI